MKAGLLSIAALSAVAIAQPHMRHQAYHEKRQDVTVTVAETDIVTAQAAEQTVYVNAGDSSGNNEGSGNNNQVDNAPNNNAGQPPSAQSVTTSTAPQQPDNTGSPSPPPATGGSSGGHSTGYGITYSPYVEGYQPKSEAMIDADYAKIIAEGYTSVRLYDVNYNQIAQALAKTPDSVTVLPGILNNYVADDNLLRSQAAAIVDQVAGKWNRVQAVWVGNEGIADGAYSIDRIGQAVETVRGILSAAGYNGKVITVDRFDMYKDNPGLCKVGDFVAANCHAFFTNTVDASGAGQYVHDRAADVAGQCGVPSITITETGWPSGGNDNGAAKVGTAEQSKAVQSIKDAFSSSPSSVYLFSAFDNPEKSNAPSDTFGVERFWGLYGASQA